MVYTMDVLGLTFQQKTVKVDMRKDDYFISQDDDEDPLPCKKDNISNDLCLNQDPKKLEAYQNSVSQKSAMLRSQKTLMPGNKQLSFKKKFTMVAKRMIDVNKSQIDDGSQAG